jgi:hypothetical protein
MQVELLDRKRWRTRVELANAIFEYLVIFHNRQRRHSALGMLTPVEFEAVHQLQSPPTWTAWRPQAHVLHDRHRLSAPEVREVGGRDWGNSREHRLSSGPISGAEG